MGCFEILHENACDRNDRLYETTTSKARDESVVFGADGGKEKEGNLAVVVGHVDVGETGTVSVAKGEGGGEDVGSDDIVPFKLREHLWDNNGGNCGQGCVADESHPQWDVFS